LCQERGEGSFAPEKKPASGFKKKKKRRKVLSQAKSRGRFSWEGGHPLTVTITQGGGKIREGTLEGKTIMNRPQTGKASSKEEKGERSIQEGGWEGNFVMGL